MSPRELSELLFVADIYYGLATDEIKHLSDEEKERFYKKRNSEFRNDKELDKKLTKVKAHINSAFIRLYSIDDSDTGNHRKVIYKNIKKSKKGKISIIKDIKSNLKEIIHFMVRNNVAHPEPGKGRPEFYYAIIDCLNELTTNDEYEYLIELLHVVKKEKI